MSKTKDYVVYYDSVGQRMTNLSSYGLYCGGSHSDRDKKSHMIRVSKKAIGYSQTTTKHINSMIRDIDPTLDIKKLLSGKYNKSKIDFKVTD